MNWEQLQAALLSPLTWWLFVVPMLVFTAIDAVSYFGKRHLDFKWFLTTWGLFGTFLGIFNGLVAFDTTKLEASVPLLLDGLKLAFLTSIMGMALATSLQIIQSILSHSHASVAKVRNQRELLEELVAIQQQATQQSNDNFKELYTHLEKQQQATQQNNDNLKTIQEVLESIHSVLYENRRHFVKLGAMGEELSDGATEWAAVQDNDTGLIWEHKAISGPRDQARRLTWLEETTDYIGLVNKAGLAGFSDWRLPSVEELRLIQMPSGPDQRFFGPLTDTANSYPGIFSVDADPQDPRKGMVVMQITGIVKAAIKAHILLVRGGSTA